MNTSHIQSLTLTAYRNFTNLTTPFDIKQTLILGHNGQGKTNILESIALLSIGKSFKGKSLSECVQIGKEVAHIRLQAQIDGEEIIVGAALVTSGSELQERGSVKYTRNGVAKRKGEVIGMIKTVVFRPEDLEIITGSPGAKRDFFNTVLVQVSHVYATALAEYERALKHRNKLILSLREGTAVRKDFFFWDQLLIKHADVITRERSRFIHFLNTYVPFPVRICATYDCSLMTEERLHKYAVAEVGAGKTLVGPQKDSIILTMQLSSVSFSTRKERESSQPDLADVSNFGSRGQQRLAILWLKIGQLMFIEQETKQVPVLLLDDIFSELDEHNREIIFSLFPGRQVIMTSAEQLSFLPNECQNGTLIELNEFQ